MLSDIVGKWVIRVWSTKKCLNTEKKTITLSGNRKGQYNIINSERIKDYLKRTVRIWRAGLHLSFNISRQILPSYTTQVQIRAFRT
jgi:hypothetical protein